jgi:hypothetical protein
VYLNTGTWYLATCAVYYMISHFQAALGFGAFVWAGGWYHDIQWCCCTSIYTTFHLPYLYIHSYNARYWQVSTHLLQKVKCL